MMNKATTRLIITFGFVGLSLCSLSHAATPEASFPEKHLRFFKQYCLNCHDTETREGTVDLESLSFQISTVEQAERWQKVLNVLNSGEMPPEDSEQPGNTEKADLLEDLAKTMVTARRVLSDSQGQITMRRLNHREYGNTVHELTGVRLDLTSLPTDGGSGAFDTVGASQFISSDQFELYLKLGRDAIDEVFERRAARQHTSKLFRVEPELTVNVDSLESMREMEETNARFMRWKAKVDLAAEAPENQEIVADILKENPNFDLTTWPSASAFLFYRHANRLIGSPDPKDFGFRDDNDATFSFQGGYSRKYEYLKHYANLPHSSDGTYLKLTWGIQRIDITPKAKDLPPGSYNMRIRAGVVEGSPSFRHFIQIGYPQRVNGVRAGFASLPISSHHVAGTIENPSMIETKLEVGLHSQKEFGLQERQPTNGKSLRNAFNQAKRDNGYGTPPAIWIDWVELEGPLPASGPVAPLMAILDKYLQQSDVSHGTKDVAQETQRARMILSEFAEIAFRHVKPESIFIEKLIAIFRNRVEAGEGFDAAIRYPLSVILASPGFLYLNEPADENQHRRLKDRELAVRLAYFLWSAPPDQQLMDLANRGELQVTSVLRDQVNRMIDDPKSDEFISGFVHQWLDMERLDFFQFDVNMHREFDENVRAAARQEVYESFAYLLRSVSGGKLGELLKSDYVFVNALLADYYGIDGIEGDDFQKVSLPSDSPRGGLLGMAAIHAMGSDGVVSSPVERGAWVLRHLMNDPPPPAPPNVPQISRLAGQLLTTRERLVAHQEEAQCASCHRKIDPIGFGLENFDAAGKWRTEDGYRLKDERGKKTGRRKTWVINSSGSFYNGPFFEDFFQLRDLIAEKEEDFAVGFTQNLIEYALGRAYGFTDQDLAMEIVDSARAEQFSIREFIHVLVQSDTFKTK